MDDKEFLDFLQKQQDFEDEQRQGTELWKSTHMKILSSAQNHAARKRMTWEQYIAWVESFQQYPGLVVILRNLEEWSK